MQTYCFFVHGPAVTTLEKAHQPAMALAGSRAFALPHPLLARQGCLKHTSPAWSLPNTASQVCKRSRRFAVSAQAGSSSRQRNIQQIPIFPLGMVALPGAVTPLNIFEARLQRCICFADACTMPQVSQYELPDLSD